MSSPKPVVLRLCDVQDETQEFKRFDVLTHDGQKRIAHVVNRIDQEAVKIAFEGGEDPTGQGVAISIFDVIFYNAKGEESQRYTFDDNLRVLDAIEAWAQSEGMQMYGEVN